jgi:phenylalanyl-tRNA synthetase beta chain
MKVSYNWLKTYFKEEIPSPEKLVDLFTFHFSEVEGVEKKDDNTIFDIKILPDRAHYALSHKGVAEEISVLSKIPINKNRIPNPPEVNGSEKVNVKIEDTNFCRRYISCVVKGIDNTGIQEGAKGMLEGIGARSISKIVDATNMVMFDIGQPMHAFDVDMVEGDIVVRSAKNGEEIILLDDRKIILTSDDFVIADDRGPLAIAGVKGGKRAQVTIETKNIIIESANFHPTKVRKTSTKYDLRSESSKRFENEITPELALPAMQNILAFIKELSPNAEFGPVVDVYPKKSEQTVIIIDPRFISKKLGIEIPEKDIKEILELLGIKNENWKLTIPFERLDLTIPEDIVEEIGRIYGYDRLPSNLPKKSSFKPEINKNFYYAEKIKNILADWEFSDVYTYSLVSQGEFEIEKALASDKNFLRPNLTQGIVKSLELNYKNAELLGLTDDIKIFEIGNVFCKEGEHTALAIGIKNIKKKQEKEKEKIKKVRDDLLNILKAKANILCTVDDSGGIIAINGKTIGITNNTEGIVEMNLDALVDSLPTPDSYDDLNLGKAVEVEYKKFSPFPYIVRDIALFVSSDTKVEDVKSIIEEASKVLTRVKGPDLFDQFEKEGKKSFAFRIIFQSMERTLSDEEVNKVMERVYDSVKEKGWQVR